MDTRISWATSEMALRLSEPFEVGRLAAAVNLSTSRFSHLFRAETGSSPTRYMQTLRMTKARALLESTFLTVKEVMVQVGCNDPSHFARDFRRFHGVPPSQIRAMAEASRKLG